MPQTPAGWYRDPSGRFAHRYWNGEAWTEHVNSGGSNTVDRLTVQDAALPPAPGTAQSIAPPSQPTVAVTQTSTGSGGTVGWLLLAFAVVALAIVVVVVLINRDGATTDTTTPATTVAPTTEAPTPTAPDDAPTIPPDDPEATLPPDEG